MHKKLILKVFEKAKTDQKQLSGIEGSTNKNSENISESLLNDHNCVFGGKSLRILYNKAIKDEDVLIKQLAVLESLSKFLGYDSYNDFKNHDSTHKEDVKSKGNRFWDFIIKSKVSIILITIFIVTIVFLKMNRQRWMVWEDNKYVEVEFNSEKYRLKDLKIYKDERIKNFRKIDKDCNIEFFDKTGNVQIWYGKNLKGKLELFTSLGLHPETGKTLKPISKYMINKYICTDQKK